MNFVKKCVVVLVSVALSGLAYARGPGGGMGSGGGQGRMGGQQMSSNMGGSATQGTQTRTQTRDPSIHTEQQQPTQVRERIHTPGTGGAATVVTN